MFHTAGKCPSCNALLSRVKAEHIDVEGKQLYKGIAYVCPQCDALISIQIDPLAPKGRS